MASLSRLWMPVGSSGSVNNIEYFNLNIVTLFCWDCHWFSSFKITNNLKMEFFMIDNDVQTISWLFSSWSFSDYHNLDFFRLAEITASTSVSPLLAANSLFLWSYKLPTPMSCKHQVFRRIFQIDDIFISCDICTFVVVKFSWL